MHNYYWLIVMVIFLVVEIITLGLSTIWFAAGALVAYVAALIGANLAVQIIIFLVVSLVALFFTRPIALRYFNKDRQKTNVDTIIGMKVKVVEKIDNINSNGKVLINGIEWTARATGNEIFEKDELVVVKEVSGVKVICEKAE